MEVLAKGIDVSRWQGTINWYAVKKSGIDFAIIKAGGSDDGFYEDSKFQENYANAKANGMPVGTYYFVGPEFVSAEDGVADAERFMEIIKGKTFEYPVILDLESTDPADKDNVTDACIAFLDVLEDAGYYAAIYASDISGFQNRLDNSRLADYDHWVAGYGKEPSYVTDYGMWQYTSSGTVTGINGNVDMNYAYKDYPSIVGTNGVFEPTSEPAEEPTTEETQDCRDSMTNYAIGEEVSFSVIYTSSDSEDGLNPLYSNGTITAIQEGARNPYLINDGMGWVNDDAISGDVAAPSQNTGNGYGNIVSGSKVRVTNCVNYDGTIVTAWYNNDGGYDVGEVTGDRAVLYHDDIIFDAFNVDSLELI